MNGLWLGVVVLAGGAPGAAGGSVSFQTELVRMTVSGDGVRATLTDRRDRTSYLARDSPALASVTVDGRRHEARRVTRQGERLQVAFADTPVTAAIRVEEQAHWLTFELVGLSDETGVEDVTFLHLHLAPLAGRRSFGVAAGCVRNGRIALACQTLNLHTESAARPVKGETVFMGRAHARFGFKGARVALIATSPDAFLKAVEALELREKLPHPTLGGVWARTSPDALKSYLFIDMTEANADEIVRIARELHFGYIMVYANVWSKTLGSYEINTRCYPRGMPSLKAVADKAHAAGLKVGIHCLNGFVNKRDPLVRPKPDPRLAKDGRVTLAADIGAEATTIATVESPSDFPSDVAFGLARQGFDVQIGDEIITYRGLSTEPPFGLRRCVRGAHRTKRSAHKKGEPVWHLTQRYGNYLADCDKGLGDAIARRYAEVINTCGLDMIYFDGGWSNTAFGREWTWRYVPYIALKSAALWRREVRVGGSVGGPMIWHLKSFMTCNDFVEIAVKRFLDHDKLRSAQRGPANFVPVDLGWWGLHSWAPHRRATTPDEIEYVCQKTLASGAFWSLETRLGKIKRCGRWPDIKQRIALYERLRLANHFADKARQPVRKLGAEFKLVGSDADSWRFVRACYGPSRLAINRASRSWTIDNDLGKQPLRFRLYALPVLEPYDAPDNPVLVDQAAPAVYVKHRSHALCTTSLAAGSTRTPAGEPCVQFRASSQLGKDDGWAEHRADVAAPGMRRTMTALIEGLPEDITKAARWARPLGVWVHGDGKGEVLNIQLRAANGGYRDHYVDVIFTGWRYCELTQPETDRVFDFKAGYSRKHAVRHFDYGRIMNEYLRYNAIPAKTAVSCLVGPVKALRERWLPVKDPTFTIADRRVVFPCEIRTEQYLEFDGQGKARLFDREGRLLRDVAPVGDIPALRSGRNAIAFSSADGAAYSQRADVSLIRFDAHR